VIGTTVLGEPDHSEIAEYRSNYALRKLWHEKSGICWRC
jgi:hypothetical protein